MGQGYSLTTLSAGSAGIDVPELADLTYERSLGNARFMKTIRGRHREGLVVAKVVMKAYQSMKLDKYVQTLLRTVYLGHKIICVNGSDFRQMNARSWRMSLMPWDITVSLRRAQMVI